MKIAEWNDMMAYLTRRQKFSNGGDVILPKPNPLSQQERNQKVFNDYVGRMKHYLTGAEMPEWFVKDLIFKKADELGIELKADGGRIGFKYGGSWADWATNYEDQMTFEEYLRDDTIVKKPHFLDRKADGGRIGFFKGSRTDLEWLKINQGKVKGEPNIYWRDLKNQKTGKVKRVYDVRITQDTQLKSGPQLGKRTTGTGRYKNLLSERDLSSLDEAIKIRNNYRAKHPMDLGAAAPGDTPVDEKKKKLKAERNAAIIKKGGYYAGPFTGTSTVHKGHTGNVWGKERITGDKLAYTPKNINEAMAAAGTGLDHKIRSVSETIEKIKKQKIPPAAKKALLEAEDAKLIRLASQSQGFKKVTLSTGKTFGGDRLTIDVFDEFPNMTEQEINEFLKKWKKKKIITEEMVKKNPKLKVTPQSEIDNIIKANIFEQNRKNTLTAASKINQKEENRILNEVNRQFNEVNKKSKLGTLKSITGKVLRLTGKVIKPLGYAIGTGAVVSAKSLADEMNIDLNPIDYYAAMEMGDPQMAINSWKMRNDPEYKAAEMAKLPSLDEGTYEVMEDTVIEEPKPLGNITPKPTYGPYANQIKNLKV